MLACLSPLVGVVLVNCTVAHSPCPNDMVMFYAMATGRVQTVGMDLDWYLHDVETLNQMALQKTYDFTKLSFSAYLQVRDEYLLLRSGAALGYGCGPLVVARDRIDYGELGQARVAIPGEMTTAHLLFSLWAPEAGNKVFVPYDRVVGMVVDGQADCGVIIHESRFVYQQVGLQAMEDLGAWWEQEHRLPIPLGCVGAKKTLPEQVIRSFEAALRESIVHGMDHTTEAVEYAKQAARELDHRVILQHVELFVNQFSLDLGPEGQAAVRKLEQAAKAVGMFQNPYPTGPWPGTLT